MADKQPYPSRKAYREAKQQAAETAEKRDEQRQQVEKDYAREQPKQQPAERFDAVTFKKVNSLKKRLNWAIGIVIGLLVVVAGVLFLL